MKNIKICGITNIEDARDAQALGAWAIGYIFYSKSERYISPEVAGEISPMIGCEKVGVFVNNSLTQVVNFCGKSGITVIQLHGDEDFKFLKELKKLTNLPIIKAIRVKSKEDLAQANIFQDIVDYFLFDTYSKQSYGGTGESFNWSILEGCNLCKPIILSGGINTENIKKAILTNSFALDISSGVEKSKGIKDIEKMKKIFESI